MRTILFESIDFTPDQKRRLEKFGSVEVLPGLSEEERREAARDANVVIADWVDPNPYIGLLQQPALIALMSTGYGWIDLQRANHAQTFVSNVPGYATEAVAEHLLALILSVSRRLPTLSHLKDETSGLGIELSGRQLGILGYGRIGSRLAELGKTLGMNICACERPGTPSSVRSLSLDELLKTSDVIAISCSANDSSSSLLYPAKLDLLKHTAIVVGTTWGIADFAHLIKMVESGRLFGVGFDAAFEADSDHILPSFDPASNILLTPHIGFKTLEALDRQKEICISNVISFYNGHPTNIVNRVEDQCVI
jgi:glycerate dehydrogenase